jgi:cytidylate kinase
MASKESGLSEEIFENHDEKPTNSFLYSLVMDTYSVNRYASANYSDMPLNHKVFLAMFETIKKLASQESCVIVGRCADYALAEMDNCVSVFIHGELDYKINRLVQTEGWTVEKAKSNIKKTDKKRENYYNYFSSKKWGEAKSYHVTLDSSRLSSEGCAEMIIKYLKVKKLVKSAELKGIAKEHKKEQGGMIPQGSHELNTWYSSRGLKARLYAENGKLFIFYNSHGENSTFQLSLTKRHDGGIGVNTDRPGLPDKYLRDASPIIQSFIGE